MFEFTSLQAQAPTASRQSSNSSEANVFAKVVHCAFNPPSQGFSIYVDKDANKPTSLVETRSSSSVRSERLDLDPVVTALSRQPLTEVFPPPSIKNDLIGRSFC